jgi:DNA-binding transcriptional ArsR family regulator
MAKIDIAAYCFDETEIPSKRSKTTRYRVKHDQRFICVPESWATRAFEVAKQRQTAGPLIIGLVLWQRYHMEHAKQPFKLTNNMLSRFGIERRSVTRWLGMLEKAGLISLQRFDHRSPLITIIWERTDEGIKEQ